MSNSGKINQQELSKKVWMTGGILAFIVILLLLFKNLFSVVLLTFAGLMIAVYLLGFAGLIKRYLHLPNGWSVVLSGVINLVLLVAFFWFVGARLQQQVAQLSETLPETFEQVKARLQETTLGSKVVDQLESATSSEKTRNAIKQFFSSAFGVLSDLYIVLLIALFFTSSPMLYRRGLVHLLPENAKDKGDALLTELFVLLKKWLKAKIIGIFFIGILTGIGLMILGMPLVLTLALIAGLLNFIPNFGPLIALIPAVLLAFMQGTSTVILVIVMYTGIQLLQTAVTQPLVQKKMVNIPPALIIISQLVMGSLGGFWGILLATPTVAVLMKLVNELYVRKQSYHKYELKED